jgi:hypothetical protein
MKKLILVSLAVIASHASFAQEKKQFEVKNFDGMVSILASADNLTIQGYDGKSVIIEAEQTGELKTPEKAQGLKMVTPGGLDNTGMSATVKETTASLVTRLDKDGKPVSEDVKVLEITLTNTKNLFKNYVIKVPRKVNVVFKEDNSNWMNSQEGVISFSGLSSELDVSCQSCSIDVSDFRGNLIANNSFGKGIKVEFAELSQERISSIRAHQGDIEVILPATTKANLKLNAGQGNVYTDFDLEKAVVKDSWTVRTDFRGEGAATINSNRSDGWGASRDDLIVEGKPVMPQKALPARSVSGTKVGDMSQSKNRYNTAILDRLSTERFDYTINGGGVYLSINSSFGGNVYLRKK